MNNAQCLWHTRDFGETTPNRTYRFDATEMWPSANQRASVDIHRHQLEGQQMSNAAQSQRAARYHPERPEQSAPDMSIPDVARYLGVNQSTVRVMIADGRLTAYRLGARVIRLRRSEIDAAMQRMQPA
jgi:excisionase family DNA binding protein